MNTKKHTIKHLLLAVMVLLIVGSISPINMPGLQPVTVQAAVSASTKKRALAAYKKLLRSKRYDYFVLFDVDKDGLKELLVSKKASSVEESIGKAHVFTCYIYTYNKNRLQYIDNTFSMWGMQYNTVTKRLHGSRGGGGSIENWYYTITKNKNLKKNYLDAIEHHRNNSFGYDYYYLGKKITKKAYNTKLKLWNKQCRTLYFYSINNSNIKKYAKL